MVKILSIAAGGAIGTVLRYLVSGIDYKFSQGVFPISTFVVNVTGSFVIGFLWGICERIDVASNVRMFAFVGILGGYTTFSTFGLESFNLFRDGEVKIALMNIAATNIIGVFSVFAGFAAARLVTALMK